MSGELALNFNKIRDRIGTLENNLKKYMDEKWDQEIKQLKEENK